MRQSAIPFIICNCINLKRPCAKINNPQAALRWQIYRNNIRADGRARLGICAHKGRRRFELNVIYSAKIAGALPNPVTRREGESPRGAQVANLRAADKVAKYKGRNE